MISEEVVIDVIGIDDDDDDDDEVMLFGILLYFNKENVFLDY